MMAGSDFIKTSTGKESVNATFPVALVMVRAVRDYYQVPVICISASISFLIICELCLTVLNSVRYVTVVNSGLTKIALPIILEPLISECLQISGLQMLASQIYNG